MTLWGGCVSMVWGVCATDFLRVAFLHGFLVKWLCSTNIGSLKMKVEATQLCLTLCYSVGYRDSPGQNTGVGSQSLLQRIFLTQESNQDLLHCRQILTN